jgi:hypothetical protein
MHHDLKRVAGAADANWAKIVRLVLCRGPDKKS